MDVLKPELMWIEGRCYRVNQTGTFKRNEEFQSPEEPVDVNVYDDEECEKEYEVTELENGRFQSSLRVPSAFFPYVVGAKGATRRRLETETKTQIRIPRQGENGDIVITGNIKKDVCSATRRLNLLVMNARQRQDFTHFLSIPITGESVKKGFLEFKKVVLEEFGSCRGVDSSIFQTPERLHLTLGTLVLLDTAEVNQAVETLEECKEQVIETALFNQLLKLRMEGVEYMNDDPAEVDVLYGKVKLYNESDSLQVLADELTNYFTKKGLMRKQYEQVKLHVTLMNTLFRNDKSGISEHETSRRKRKPRESFDASKILKKFENFNFGEQMVTEVHLSQRYSTGENGYYKSSCKLSLL